MKRSSLESTPPGKRCSKENQESQPDSKAVHKWYHRETSSQKKKKELLVRSGEMPVLCVETGERQVNDQWV